MDRDQALAKIKKCLALANSGNPHEAAAGLRQAQKLMAEHDLGELDVELAQVSEGKTAVRSSPKNLWEALLTNLVADSFGCVHLYRQVFSWDSTSKFQNVFIGVGAAPEVAKYAYEVLSRQLVKDRSAHIKKQPSRCKSLTKTARGDEFARGWIYGVRGLVERFAGKEENQLLIEQYMQAKFPDLKTQKSVNRALGRNVNSQDLYEGISAGRSADLNRGVGGLAKQGLLS